ncbi:MAG: LysM domain-containing protein [Tepidimonas sp.]|uniref:LysM peptidoglycan-binding domain-containing protein n=1 Tax=Tepidimonas sp. TaxID=2002775 RepID=UPI00259E33B3|nr:LysM domain-containing protein [Tepidimonas sp.]MDM7456593.1 LysM domain-containing protein [Tepidimonas sp.]
MPAVRSGIGTFVSRWGVAALLGGMVCIAAAAPPYSVTPQQRDAAEQVAQAGVPLTELAPNAPERYTVQRGDTLWDIAARYLQRPWRWPQLWGMNLQQIRNPHLIYPGQVLLLTRAGDRAVLQLAADTPPTVKLSPRVRAEPLRDLGIPPLPLGAIEPFLADVDVVDTDTHEHAPRIVAGPQARVLLGPGDRAYARGQYGAGDALSGDALEAPVGRPRVLSIYRNATALRDPETSEVLGYETHAVGRAQLARSERVVEGPDGQPTVVPATVDILQAREEIRIGDRLLPQSGRDTFLYIPHAPAAPIQGQIVKVHGDALRYAGQNQIVVLNRGRVDGLEVGHVLAVLKERTRLIDKTDEVRPDLLLPGERNGLMMVFRTFERVSHALILQITDGVQSGDRFANP